MYVVTVLFEIDREHADAFRQRMRQQATNSLELEPGCKQFDICYSADAESCSESNPVKCFLYEKYDNRAAFDAHLASEHFQDFDMAVGPWVVAKQASTWIED